MSGWWGEDDPAPWPRAVPPLFDDGIQHEAEMPYVDVADRRPVVGALGCLGWAFGCVSMVVGAFTIVWTVVRRLLRW